MTIYNLIIIILIFGLYQVESSSQQSACFGLDTSNCYILKKFEKPKITLEKKWESENFVLTSQSPIIDDVDGDCVPEIISISDNTSSIMAEILVIDSRTGRTKFKFNIHGIASIANSNMLIVDVNNDGLKEIIFCTYPLGNFNLNSRIACFNFKGQEIWVSKQMFFSINNYKEDPALGIADFNQDGLPEIYVYNRIFNAQTGVLLAEGGDTNGVGNNDLPNLGAFQLSIAAQLDIDESDLELAAGFSIYKIKLTNLNGLSGNSMTPMNVRVNGQFLDGRTSVADINQDGQLDVIVAHSSEFSSHVLYIYTINNNTPILISTYFNYPGINHIGTPTVADIDGDGKPNILLSIDNAIHCYSYNNTMTLTLNWSYGVIDSRAYSNIPTFDLDGNGIPEIIHRGDSLIYIIDGSTTPPSIFDSKLCFSITLNENCTIADIDNTRSAKICITCNPEKTRYSVSSKLTVFGPPDGQHWAPARPIWNQYAYNPLFINDDLTVPRVQKNQATYMNGKYNNFMQQESLLDSNGYYKLAAASLTGDIFCVDYDQLSDSFVVRFNLHNRCDASRSADADLPVSFYSANPITDSALIGVYRTRDLINPGDTLRDLNFSFPADTALHSLYLVVNTRRNSSGVFDSTHFDQPECDYTDNFFFTIDLPKIQRENQSVCEGSGYIFYDTTIYDQGKYIRRFQNQKGCDSIIQLLDLEISSTVRTMSSLSVCDRYDWNGQTITRSGTYTDTTQTSGGCDSISTLVLNIRPSSTVHFTESSCDSFPWNGQVYTQSGNYTVRTTNEFGCDSIATLNLSILPSSTSTQIQTSCDSFLWNGHIYTQSGNYSFKTSNQYGCDSTAKLQLDIVRQIQVQQSKTACDQFLWDGKILTQSGIYTSLAQSTSGCDSITTLNLNILPSSSMQFTESSCDSFPWNGQVFTQSGNYTFRTMNQFGCDSITTLNLSILPSSTSTQIQTSCDNFLWNGQIYTQSGNYSFKTSNHYGCDSTANLQLKIVRQIKVQQSETACDQFLWDGKILTQSGIYTSLALSSSGCDSITTLNLNILPSSSMQFTETSCDSLLWNGQVFTQSGNYTFKATNQFGCDSIAMLNLSILPSSTSTQIQTSCDSFLWNGQIYSQSGNYSFKTSNQFGCDSTANLQLHLHPSSSTSDQAEACGSYYWPAADQTLLQSGQYQIKLQSTFGCDSLISLLLFVHPQFQFSDTIYQNKPYLWPINGQLYQQSGTYEHRLRTEHNCDSVFVLILKIDSETRIYAPNVIAPGGINSWFSLYDNGSGAQIERLSIFDRWGNLVWSKDHFPVNDPKLGWDGSFKGQAVLHGVYTWTANVRFKDGKLIQINGDVTVVK